MLGDALKLEVTAAPVGGAANAEVEALVAELLGVAPRDVSVVAGAGARCKVVEIRGVGGASAAARLAVTAPAVSAEKRKDSAEPGSAS